MNRSDPNPAALSGPVISRIVWILCALAAVHVFVFSAAFPFGNNMDESWHFDLVLKYAHGHIPRGLEPISQEASQYDDIYGSPEFRWSPEYFGGAYRIPFWLGRFNSPEEKVERAKAFEHAAESWRLNKDNSDWSNYESSQQPLYYATAAVWWKIGRAIGMDGLQAIYWLKFLNILFVAGTVWLGYGIARLIFPENVFMQIGVPALLAVFPQQSFYSIQNDVLSPLTFGLVFYFLINFLRAKKIPMGVSVLLGLAIAGTFLTKLSNVPLIAVAALVIFWKLLRLHRSNGLKSNVLPIVAMFLCAAVPICVWLGWNKYAFGDFTGTVSKTDYITWTRKPFGEWFHHPIFSLNGMWTFVSELLVTFWQGELRWHAAGLNLPANNAIIVVLSLTFIALALLKIRCGTWEQRRLLLLSLALMAAGAAFLGYLSISYDFGMCPSPSKEHPYFTAGRLISGALIPFCLLFIYGTYSLFRDAGPKIQFTALTVVILVPVVTGIVTDWPVFQSQYNWYHM